ncbi:ABC transporter permease [Labrys neptuniae]|uniref:ABC transporter permease n=1 Tax=Labrys neptuniae TaxID=376174 RepID=UPI003F59527C
MSMLRIPRFRFNAALGSVFVGIVVAMALLSLVWTPYPPMKVHFTALLKPPSAAHWLGTDKYGHDVLSGVMAGASISLGIACLSVGFAVVLGTALGLLAGYLKGTADRVLMVVSDALLAFPGLLLALGVIVIVGRDHSVGAIVLALGLAYTPSVLRVVRGTVMSVREREYIEASRVIGNSEWKTMVKHVLPNCLAPIIVLATSMLGWVILSESSLSFLGLGAPPEMASWGNMLAAARPYIERAAWLGIAPGLCLAVTLLGINLMGDAIRDRFDPRMEGQR